MLRKASVMQAVNGFYELLDKRTLSTVADAQQRTNSTSGVILMFVLLVDWLVLSPHLVWRKVQELVQLEEETRNIGKTDYVSQFKINSNNEIIEAWRKDYNQHGHTTRLAKSRQPNLQPSINLHPGIRSAQL